MLAELILTHALSTNVPLYVEQAQGPMAENELRLRVEHQVGRVNLTVEPYVWLDGNHPGRAGGEGEVSFTMQDVSLGLYHWSEHNLDVNGPNYQFNGVRLRWKMQ